MAIRIGDIELNGVQNVRADDNRSLVELRVPGQSGAVFQDLGRTPASVTLEGLITGEDSEQSLETLRAAYQNAEPMSFASDIAVGTEMTEVVIADMLIRQEAGYRDRYHFTLTIREHIEPPENIAANQAAVQREADEAADAWAADAVDAEETLRDPASLPEALAENPDLLDQIAADQLADAIGENIDDMDGDALGDVLDSVIVVDPSKADAVLTDMKKKGTFSKLMEKLVNAGRVLAKFARKVGSLLGSVGDVLDLIAKIKTLKKTAKRLTKECKALREQWTSKEGDPIELLHPPEPKGSTPKSVLKALEGFLVALGEVLETDILRRTLESLRQKIEEWNIQETVKPIAEAFINALSTLGDVFEVLFKTLSAIKSSVKLIKAAFDVAEALSGIIITSEDASSDSPNLAAYVDAAEGWADLIPDSDDHEAVIKSYRHIVAILGHYTTGEPTTLPKSVEQQEVAA